ncbi:Wzz/FepE/Etk N-terminal domain-containing protein [Eubacteriaceae bacterium ES3]|nr:Wzz/FepE/Etk N-terminal domain-containing protein [Eubacteriaceae bacterium ES3]
MTNNTEQNDELEIDLLKLIKALWHKAWLLVLVSFIFGGGALAYTYLYVDPLYESSAQMYVNNNGLSFDTSALSISSTDITASKSLVDTYMVILKSRQMLNEVIADAQLDLTYDELVEMITAASVDSTEVFEILVTDTDPYRAELIANTIAEDLPERISSIVEGSSARIVDYAVVPAAKSSPNLFKYTLMGALVGFVLSAGLIIIIELSDTTIREEDYLVTNYTDIPLLAIIPDMDRDDSNNNYYSNYKQ